MKVFAVSLTWLTKLGKKKQCKVCGQNFAVGELVVSKDNRGWWPKHQECARRVNVEC